MRHVQVATQKCRRSAAVLHGARGTRTVKISQQELAYLVGTSRQRIDEALPLLRDVGAIRAEYGTITLLELQRLRLYRAPTQTGDASARRTLRSQFS